MLQLAVVTARSAKTFATPERDAAPIAINPLMRGLALLPRSFEHELEHLRVVSKFRPDRFADELDGAIAL